jgi:hypothetical protein
MPSGAVFRAVAPIEAQLGANQPVRVTLHLASDEPLAPQTVQVLSGQLSRLLSYPVELHARVELDGEGHTLTIEKPSLEQGVTARDRQAISQLLQSLPDQPDFRLVITLALAGNPESKPPLQQQVEALLARSRLNPSQWALRRIPLPPMSAAGPPSASPPAGTPPKGAANQPVAARCEFKLYQEF